MQFTSADGSRGRVSGGTEGKHPRSPLSRVCGLSGWTVLRSAIRLRHLAPDAPVSSLPIFEHERGWPVSVLLPAPRAASDEGQRMIVHVWTAVATASDPVRRPLIDRYVAAVDRQGTVSTGHAALEMPPDLYISHYRADDTERTPDEFRRALRRDGNRDRAAAGDAALSPRPVPPREP